MPLRKTSAVIVRALDYGEADRIVTLVAPDVGRLTGIAKGAKRSRRRFGAALELFTLVSATYFEKPAFELVRLEEAEILAGFPMIRRDLTKIAHAAYLVELAGRAVQPREPASRIFRLLVETLGAIDREPADEGRLRAFELRLLALLGYSPELRRCARCRRPRPAAGRFRVSLHAGGLVCRACLGDDPAHGAGRMDPGPVAADRSPAGGDLVPVSGTLLDRLASRLESSDGLAERHAPLAFGPEEAAEARALLPRLLSIHLGAEMKALGFIDRMAQERVAGPPTP